MKNHAILALAAAGLATAANGASFLSIDDTTANASSPWAIGVAFEVPTGGNFIVDDIQVFDVAAGNTLRVSLWSATAPDGVGNAQFVSTVSSTGAGGFTSIGNAPIYLSPGKYTLTVGGFEAANSLADKEVGSVGNISFANAGDFVAGSLADFVAINTDPTFFNPSNVGLNLATSSPRWKAVNFSYSPVPEPETYAMVAGAALVGFGLWRRRQAK